MATPVSKSRMQRPVLVTVISLLLSAAAAYLWVIAATLLVWPGTFSLMSGNELMHGLELAGPFMMLLVGAGYAVVGWGLFRLRNWARFAVLALLVLGVASLVPRISMAQLGVPVLWYGFRIAIQVALGWYLAQAPAVIDAFTPQRHRSTQILTDNPDK